MVAVLGTPVQVLTLSFLVLTFTFAPRSCRALVAPPTWKPSRLHSRNLHKLYSARNPPSPAPATTADQPYPPTRLLTISGLQRQVFCNVELNGAQLQSVGFDMDFTLAQYNTAFDMLAFDGAKKKLVEVLNYPRFVLDLEYSPTEFRRGLIIDKLRGNIIKVDRHRYVRQAMHGLRQLTPEERKNTYMQSVHTFTESHYAQLDTLFLLVDAVLFAHLVEQKNTCADPASAEFFAKISFEQLYRDIRHCVDLCHRDGAIKGAVMRDPSKYIIYDEGFVKMMRHLKRAGKKTFLLTNSMWEYTNVVMNYLVYGTPDSSQGLANPSSSSSSSRSGKPAPSDVATPPESWGDLFDVVIVGANKPAFLVDEYLSLFQVDPTSGALRNVEDKDALSKEFATVGKVFQGGHWQDLHTMLDVTAGERILYVGDHMYADILRSKRTLGWRTCLIIPELEGEILTSMHEAEFGKEILRLRRLQYDLDEYMDLLRQRIGMGVDCYEKLRDAEQKSDELKTSVRELTDKLNAKFNPNWGQLFKAGHQESRFAKQVTDYACLYTSRATNLGMVNPNRPFRPVFEVMPHDQAMLDAEWYS